MGAKLLNIWLHKIDGFPEIYNGIRYLVLFATERYNAIYDRINYPISGKSGTTYNINHNFARIRIDSYTSLPIEKHWLSIMLEYSLSQLQIRIKMTITTMYF